nr:cupin domain-containing protein [Aureimonas sp. Leaf460]
MGRRPHPEEERSMAAIGLKIQELRRRRQLSARQLAIRSGISHSTISLLERDRLSPSLDTLSAILEAMGSTLTGFFSEIEATTPFSPFYRADELAEIGRADGISYRMVGINHPNRHLLLLCETYTPGSDTGQAFSHTAQEAGVVTKGSVEVTVGEETRLLVAGDAYYFDSQTPHRFRNPTDSPAELISAITPPTY